MRELKKKLADEKVYIFTTLPRSKVKAIQLEQRLPETVKLQKELIKLRDKLQTEDEGLTVKELERMSVLEEGEIRELMVLVAMSLATKHKEFIITPENKDTIIGQIETLMDMRDLRQTGTFAVQGTVQKEFDELESENIIDLSPKE